MNVGFGEFGCVFVEDCCDVVDVLIDDDVIDFVIVGEGFVF